MAGFFSLGSSSASPSPGGGSESGGGRSASGRLRSGPTHHHHHHHHNQSDTEIPPPESLFWYKNDQEVPSSYRTTTFELWQQQQQQQQQAQQHLYYRHHQDLYSSAAELGVGPSSINAVGGGAGGGGGGSDDSSSRSAFMMMRSSSSSGGGISCQDCGNQAKKDCVHMRCRTCCKSRGFECQTHVKSTWVPAAKRRERQQHVALQQQQQNLSSAAMIHQQEGGEGEIQVHSKRHREINTTQHQHQIICPTTTRNLQTNITTTSSGLDVGNFPAEMSSNAVFRCVRVSAVEENDDQYAYQTAVSVGGHLFKGILYDQGPEGTNTGNYSSSTTDHRMQAGAAGESSSVGIQPLDLITTTSTTAANSQPFDPSSLYPTPLNTYIAGTQYFLPPRS